MEQLKSPVSLPFKGETFDAVLQNASRQLVGSRRALVPHARKEIRNISMMKPPIGTSSKKEVSWASRRV